jgi:hypothetical protein
MMTIVFFHGRRRTSTYHGLGAMAIFAVSLTPVRETLLADPCGAALALGGSYREDATSPLRLRG